MPIPIDEKDSGYRFHKALNEDIRLVDTGLGEYDMDFVNGDIVNLTGLGSLHNAIIIAILTRFRELQENQLYTDFGCRIHELIKANPTNMTQFTIEKYIEETIGNMRRVKTINSINVTKIEEGYTVNFNITSITDEQINGTVTL